MLDEARPLTAMLSQQYGHLLPPGLISSAVRSAPGAETAEVDVAALADAALRAPAPRS